MTKDRLPDTVWRKRLEIYARTREWPREGKRPWKGHKFYDDFMKVSFLIIYNIII